MRLRIGTLFWRELAFRPGSLALGILGVAAVAACLTGSHAFLNAHDHQTNQLTSELEARSIERMSELRDAARRFSKNLGFNSMVLPPGQALGDLYANGKSSVFLSEAQVTQLADAELATLNHLRPILRQRIEWPEQSRTIVLVGVRGQVYIKAPSWQKPIEEAIDPGKVHVGSAIAKEMKLAPGSSLRLMGRDFTVEHVLPERANEDDLTLRIDLDTAQELLGHEDKVSAVLALSCGCANGDPEVIRRELDQLIPGVQIVDFAIRTKARKQARESIAEGAIAEVEDIQESRAALREQIAGFSRVLVGLVTGGTVLLLSVLTLNNARERRPEVAMLRALGVSATGILRLFILKALLTGTLGSLLGCLLGIYGTGGFVGEGATVSVHYAAGVFAAALGIALIASLIPAARAAAEDPARILNQE